MATTTTRSEIAPGQLRRLFYAAGLLESSDLDAHAQLPVRHQWRLDVDGRN